jgi:hypothetical protein
MVMALEQAISRQQQSCDWSQWIGDNRLAVKLKKGTFESLF